MRDAEKAEKQRELVKKHGTLAELCEASKRVRDAWLAAGDAQKYEMAGLDANLDCNQLKLDPGDLPAADKEREAILNQADAIEMNATLPSLEDTQPEAATDPDSQAIDNAINQATDVPDDY